MSYVRTGSRKCLYVDFLKFAVRVSESKMTQIGQVNSLESLGEVKLTPVDPKLDQSLFVWLENIDDVQIGQVVSKVDLVEFWKRNK